MTLAYAILTLNEEREIGDCLRSLGPAAEVLLLDSGSTDGTLAAAQASAAGQPWPLRIVQRPFRDYADQRNAALALLTTDWVFFVDADERATPELIAEVATRTAAPEAPGAVAPAGFWVPRRNVIVGHRMRGAGWQPDYQLRLFQARRGSYDAARPVHELVQLDGPAEHLWSPLIHYNYRSWGQFLVKQRRYARHEAQQLVAAGSRPRARALLGQPAREFGRRYFELAGWRDGGHGFVLSLLMAWYRLLVVREARRLAQGGPRP